LKCRKAGDWFADDVNFMTNNNTEHATKVAMNGTGNAGSETKRLSGDDNTGAKSFGITDLWFIRRNARTFKIHNRIPRL
jgi:hypothetical protein